MEAGMIVLAARRKVVYQGIFDGPHDLPVGTVRTDGVPPPPVRRRLVLHDQASGRPVKELWSSASNGQYRFRLLAAGRYFIVGFDHTGLHNGEVITDIVVPVPPVP
jgi:hypothetical protein